MIALRSWALLYVAGVIWLLTSRSYRAWPTRGYGWSDRGWP